MTGGDDSLRSPGYRPPIVQRRPGDPRDTGGYEREESAAPPTLPPPRAGGPAPRTPDGFSGGAPPDRLVMDARFGELYVLFIINLLLGLVTLGIYRFWGKTRIRKYIWSHASFRGERFEYSGTGKELFLGFLLALAIFGPPFFGLYFWLQFTPPPTENDQVQVAEYVTTMMLAVTGLIVVSFYFTHVAVFATYRYRLTRTQWRGIRGTVEGNAWVYGFLGFGLSMLNGIALGWTQPWAHTVLFNYRFSRTKFGTVPVRGEMNVQGLYGPYALAWVISAIAGMVAVGVIVWIFANAYAGGFQLDHTTLIITMVAAYLIVPLTWLVTVNWYKAALLRKMAKTYTIGGLRFEFPIQGGNLLWFNVGNLLILLLSLGLLFPWIVMRYVRLTERFLAVEGEIDYAELRQSADWRPSTGEGMAEFFGLGVI